MAHLELGSMLQLTDVSEIMSWKHTDILENNKVQTAPNSLEAKVGDKPEKQRRRHDESCHVVHLSWGPASLCSCSSQADLKSKLSL